MSAEQIGKINAFCRRPFRHGMANTIATFQNSEINVMISYLNPYKAVLTVLIKSKL